MKRLAIYLAILALAAVVAEARLKPEKIKQDVTTGAIVRFTTDTSIFSRRVMFQADSANAAVIYIGDSTLDATSTATLENTALVTLTANVAWTLPGSPYQQGRGESFRLSDYYAAGTTGDKVRLVYETKVAN